MNSENFKEKEFDSDFVYLESPTDGFVIGQIEAAVSGCSRTGSPVNHEQLQSYFDSDRRLVKEQDFRKAVFRGGIEPELRAECWQFLFGLYPCSTTKREREAALIDYHARYCALRDRWKQLVHTNEQAEASLAGMETMGADPYNSRVTPELQQQLQFHRMQAKISVLRTDMADYQTEIRKAIRLIDKDVPRTDRDIAYFQPDGCRSLRVLRDMLVTYAAFRPGSTYAQGMNDIAAKFLFVFDNEVEAYWCFCNYMSKIEHEFTSDGIMDKQAQIHRLLREISPDLLLHFENLGVGELSMCHRWLLLGFKREFHYPEVLRCFEILSSRHLELSSAEAEQTRRNMRRQDFEQNEGVVRQQSLAPSTDYSLELFMCLGLLLRNEIHYKDAKDVAEVFAFTNGLAYHLDLDATLLDAERVFFFYCRKSALDCFQIVDS